MIFEYDQAMNGEIPHNTGKVQSLRAEANEISQEVRERRDVEQGTEERVTLEIMRRLCDQSYIDFYPTNNMQFIFQLRVSYSTSRILRLKFNIL
jgi:hypothetical protein